MIRTNSNGHDGDDARESLRTGLLITPTSDDRYRRLWQRGQCVALFVTLKPSVSYTALPSTSTVGEQPSRASSSLSEIVIDIRSPYNEEGEVSRLSSVNDLGQRDAVDRLVKGKDLESLRDFGGDEQVAAVFGSDLETGLSASGDPNTWKTTKPVHGAGLILLWHYFLKSCNRYTNLLLLISGLLSLFTEMKMEGPKQGWYDGVTILVALFLLVTFPAVADFHRASKLEKKMQKEENKVVEVIRSGEPQRVAVSSIMEGDIVCLKKGVQVPADGLFVGSGGLRVDEVLASSIDRDQNPFLFCGSKVLEGNGRMIVTSIGTNTAIGKMMSTVKDDPYKRTLFQSRIESPNSYADKIALCISILLTLVPFIRFLRRKHVESDTGLPEIKGKDPLEKVMKMLERVLFRPRGLVCILTTALGAVVLGFQHGMSLAIALSLSYWNQKLASDDANSQNLSACGTIGFTTAICIDVSGRLMCNEMEVEKFLIGEKEINTDQEESITSQVVREALSQGTGILFLKPEVPRSPVDSFFYSWWAQAKNSVCRGNNSSRPCEVELAAVAMEPMIMSSNKKGRGVLMRKKGGGEKIMHLHWRGSAETILSMCSHYYDCGGVSHALENKRCKFEELIKGMEDSGLLPIAFAYRQTDVEEIREDGLILLALVGLKFRKQTKSTMEALTAAGVNIILVSGDERRKVKAIALELGILGPDQDHVTLVAVGEEFRNLDRSSILEKMKHTTVIGGCLPEDKLLIIQCLKQEDHVVAFYGGLTTGDTPALKEADVGITEKIQSTEMARESSDIVITSGGGLTSLTRLFQHGRYAYHNTQKFIGLYLTTCISGILITVVSTISLGESPLTPIQLVWVNMAVCILGGMMMVKKPPSQELMAHQPHTTRKNSIMTKVTWTNFVTQVVYQASVWLIFQFGGPAIHYSMNQNTKNTMIFNTFFLCQVFNLFNAMKLETMEMFKAAIRSYYFLASVLAVLVVQVLMVQLGTSLAKYVRLYWLQWVLCFLFAALPWAFDRAFRFIFVFLSNRSIRSVGSHISSTVLSAGRTPSPYLRNMGFFIFSMFLLFSLPYYYQLPSIAQTLR